MDIANTTTERIEALAAAQKAFFATGRTRDLKYRREMLSRFEAGLKKWEEALCDALWKDLHKSFEEAFMTEIGLIYGEIATARRKLFRWARTRRVHTPITGFPSSSYIVKEPLGCTLIVSPWNYPVQLLLNPLVGAIAAGCTAILKPSPYVPEVSLTLERFIADTFPEKLAAVVQGNREVNTELFARRWDLVFCDVPTFSNSSRMRKASFDVQRDHAELLIGVSRLLTRDGTCVFSCNLRSFKLDEEALAKAGVEAQDITAQTIPEDFSRNQRIHRCYLVRRA